MDKNQFKYIVMAIKSAYPNSKILQTNEAMDIWYLLLQDMEYNPAQIATMDYISNNIYPPTIADIREKYTILTTGRISDWGESWEQVLMAIRRYGYMRESEALESLDNITRETVKRIGFQNICMSENITADRANFRMIYETAVLRNKSDNQLPATIRQQKNEMMNQLTSNVTKQITEHEESVKKENNINMDKVSEMISQLK